jgi:hypothetical protein
VYHLGGTIKGVSQKHEIYAIPPIVSDEQTKSLFKFK